MYFWQVSKIKYKYLELSLAQDHEQSKEEHDEAVAGIAEHDGEKERERYDRERRRIDLTVAGYAVGVHNALEARGELVEPVVSRRLLLGLHTV